jgi:hypothetical protein
MAFTNINKPSDYFNTVLYTGDGTSDRTITTPFSPEFTWIKMRSGVDDNVLYDIVRQTSSGVGIRLKSNSTEAESDLGDYVNLISNGFKVDGGIYNNSGFTFASWNWLANGAGVSNTDGSITSTVSANTTSGFSIVSYTGTGATATVGHGLGVAPDMIITKVRANSGNNWAVFHKSLGAGNIIWLNLTNAVDADTSFWNNTTPTSSVFSIGTQGDTNRSANTIIAYCFAEKKGFSKFGSYTGNGSTDGTFVYTGFKPAFVMLKSSSSGAVGWITHDNKRIGFNPNNYYVEPNNSNAESADTDKILLLSNGFKLISTSASWNSSGASYIYMAFAEHPFTTSTGIPTTAR